jgi:hypothetical protein
MFTLYGLASQQSGGAGGGSGTNVNISPSPDFASSSTMTVNSEPLVVPADGLGGAVPLMLYPPGFNLSGFTILDPATGESVSGAGYVVSSLSMSSVNNIQPLDDPSNGASGLQAGFYRVFHIPNFLASFSGYTFDGPTFIPVDYSDPDADVNYVDNTTVLIGGQPSDYAQFMPYIIEGVTNWGVGIYFDQYPNGTNTIQLLTTVRQSDTFNADTPEMAFSNAPAAITIGNLVAFTNWDDLIWDNTNYTFQAQTEPGMDWEIDIYDVNNNFVNDQTGYSSDGNISWTWNLTDYTGASRTDPESDPFFYPVITVEQDSGSGQSGGAQPNKSGSSTRAMPAVAAPYPSVGQWIVTYLDKYYEGSTNAAIEYQYYYPAIQTIAGGPTEWNVPATTIPIEFGTNYSQTARNSSWATLVSYLYDPDFRNLYYFGHGNANSIGGDINVLSVSNTIIGSKALPGSTAYLTSQYVHDTVTFNRYSGARPYRFVFLDGCCTANGTWPWAFGVPTNSEPLSYYTSSANRRHTRPSAFVGWNVEIGGPGWGTIVNWWAFREDWMAEWAGTYEEYLTWSFQDANTDSGWISPGQLSSNLVIDGYGEMEYFDYNYGGDWP